MPWPFRSRRSPLVSRLPDGVRVYAIGDVHGCADLLDGMERRIEREEAALPAIATAIVIFLGDYVDRGPASSVVVERLTRRRYAGLPARFLVGNHEDAMLAFLADPVAAADWLRWGGEATLASYGVAPPDPAEGAAVRTAAAALAEHMPLAHLIFLRELELTIALGDYLFVHAGIRPGIPLDRQRRRDLLFIREPFLEGAGSFDRRVVHGHSIAPAVELLPHRIGVDTGAFASGRLSCVRIEGDAATVLPD